MEPWNRFQGIESPSVCSLAGQQTNRVVVLALQAGNRFLGSLKGLQIQLCTPTHLLNALYFLEWVGGPSIVMRMMELLILLSKN
jgi:hypothetical protein